MKEKAQKKKAKTKTLSPKTATLTSKEVCLKNQTKMQELITMIGKEKVIFDSKDRIERGGQQFCLIKYRQGLNALCAAKGDWCTGPADCVKDFKMITGEIKRRFPKMEMTNLYAVMRRYSQEWVKFHKEELWNRYKKFAGQVK